MFLVETEILITPAGGVAILGTDVTPIDVTAPATVVLNSDLLRDAVREAGGVSDLWYFLQTEVLPEGAVTKVVALEPRGRWVPPSE